MRIATWNVNGLRARFDFVAIWLRERRPDVVALQELKLDDDRFPHDELQVLGYRAVTHGQKAWNGVAVLARGEPAAVRSGLPGQEALGARLVSARVGEVDVTSVYVPNGKTVDHPDYGAKLAWLDALVAHLSEQVSADRPAIVAGDFNLVPADVDSWNPERFAGAIFHTDAERERWRALLDLGLHDLFRERHPGEALFSWWDYRGGAFHRKQGLRIDFLLGTAPVLERARDVVIDRDFRKKKEGLTASDHAPVWVDLD